MIDDAFANIRFVLMGTTHPGNIGAAARAMKSMGLTQMHLVQPKIFPSADATAMASGADDLLSAAIVGDSLEAAVADCSLIVATSARRRSIPWPVLTPHDCARHIVDAAARGPVAVVFGREHAGLKNEELELCRQMIQIPTAENFRSLNLASAVQLVAYEIRQVALGGEAPSDPEIRDLATAGQMADLYAHLRETMIAVGFFDPKKPRRLQTRLRRLLNRAAPGQEEVQILRGFLAAVGDKLKPRS